MDKIKKPYKITTFESGPMDNFIYVIEDIVTKKCALVDPAWDLTEIYNHIKQKGLSLERILLTHSHHDHVNAIDNVLNDFDVPININCDEQVFWMRTYDNFDLNYGGDLIYLGNTIIKSIHTPGHTPGSTCYHIGNDLIAGDTLFVFGCGRCDLHGGNPELMYKSLKQIRETLSNNTIILPGHNYSTEKTSTISNEIKNNPFFHFNDLNKFVQYRMITHDKIRTSPYEPVPD
tara:strand:+ start:8271 stop:8966 length:696 start_codon:yes stop_codon:yes gene_type:complete